MLRTGKTSALRREALPVAEDMAIVAGTGQLSFCFAA
jgi:hypothetical protein